MSQGHSNGVFGRYHGYDCHVEFGRWANRPRLNLFGRIPLYMASHQPKVLAKRFFALAVVGVILSVVAPVIADESSAPSGTEIPAPEVSGEPIPADTPTDTPSEVPIPTDTTQASPSPSAMPSPDATRAPVESVETRTAFVDESPSPSPTPVGPLADQRMRVNIPNVLPVDPRATSRLLPAINLDGPRYLLACIEGSNLYFDIYAKNSPQSFFNNEQLVSGDMTSQLLISGTTDQVLAIINSYGGMKAVATRSAMGGLYARMSFVAMTEPTLESAFCTQGSPSNFRIVYFRGLGLGMNLIKNSLVLRR